MMNPANAPTLDIGKVVLRCLQADDAGLMAALFSDPDVVRFSRVNPLSAQQADDMLQRWLEPEDDAYWAVLSPSGEEIGVIFLRNRNRAHHAAEIGYVLDRASWGQGIASEIVAAVTRHGFEQLELCRIEAYVSTENLPSLRVLEKNGYEIEGRRRADCFKNGRFEDSVLMSILNDAHIAALTGEA